MRIFLITFVTSTMVGTALWYFGLADTTWPAHPPLTTIVIAGCLRIAV